MKQKSVVFILIVLSFVFALAGCGLEEGSSAVTGQANATATSRTAATRTAAPSPTRAATEDAAVAAVPGTLAALEGTLQQLYADVSPSVVSIQIFGPPTANPTGFPNQGFPGFPGQGVPQGQPESILRGEGSGFVWDDTGHVVTNNHVVEDAQTVYVSFPDGTRSEAEVIGTDPESDLAVLQVERDDLPTPIEVAPSSEVQVGELVVAIGNPFGEEGTMTLGIVSALGRQLEAGQSGYRIPDVIQTDAAINPGNSGGVLLNDQGALVGVPTAILSPAGASAGVGFAIPSDIVSKVVPSLIETGVYQHPYLGVSGTPLLPEIAEAMGLDATQRGALIVDVVPGGPADEAGLRGSGRQVNIGGTEVRIGGDVIVAIEEEQVTDMDDVISYLARESEVGDDVSVTVLRDGKEETFTVTLQARPGSRSPARAQGQPSTGSVRLGIVGLAMGPEVAEAMGLPAEQEGILVEQIESGSAAAEAGLRGSYMPLTVGGQEILVGGDVIVGFNGNPIAGMTDLQAQLRATEPGDTVTLTIVRDGEEQEIEVTFGES